MLPDVLADFIADFLGDMVRVWDAQDVMVTSHLHRLYSIFKLC